MSDWLIARLFIAFAITTLVAWPIALHPGLPKRKKWLLILIVMLVLMPGALAIYASLGSPDLAAF